jgi:hypothetical protein
MMKRAVLSLIPLAPIVVLACGGSVSLTDRPCPCSSGWTCCSSANVCVEDGAQCPADADAGAIGAEAAAPNTGTCPPAGAIQQTTSLAQAYTQIEGTWLICAGKENFPGIPADVIGLKFQTVPNPQSCATNGNSGCTGNLSYLIQGPTGPVPGTGFDYQLTYDISPEGTQYQLNMHPAPDSGFASSFLYSSCPTELELPTVGYLNPQPAATLIAVDTACPGDAGEAWDGWSGNADGSQPDAGGSSDAGSVDTGLTPCGPAGAACNGSACYFFQDGCCVSYSCGQGGVWESDPTLCAGEQQPAYCDGDAAVGNNG